MKLPVFKDPVTGDPSFSITVAAITFVVVMVRWCVGGLSVGTHRLELISDSSITTWLTPTLIFYLARQVTKSVETVSMAKIGSPVEPSPSTGNVNMTGAP